MRTIYPRTKFADENSFNWQLRHITSELDEVKQAYKDLNPMELTEELCDLIHSAETMLYMLSENWLIDVGKIQDRVIIKNRARGYYGQSE